jgi:sulfur carrier protein
MTIQVNGETREVAEGCTVAALLAALGRERGRIAVEVNAEVVPRATYAARILRPGDRVEVVTFVGGG